VSCLIISNYFVKVVKSDAHLQKPLTLLHHIFAANTAPKDINNTLLSKLHKFSETYVFTNPVLFTKSLRFHSLFLYKYNDMALSACGIISTECQCFNYTMHRLFQPIRILYLWDTSCCVVTEKMSVLATITTRQF